MAQMTAKCEPGLADDPKPQLVATPSRDAHGRLHLGYPHSRNNKRYLTRREKLMFWVEHAEKYAG